MYRTRFLSNASTASVKRLTNFNKLRTCEQVCVRLLPFILFIEYNIGFVLFQVITPLFMELDQAMHGCIYQIQYLDLSMALITSLGLYFSL